MKTNVRIEPWVGEDRFLELQRRINAPEMMTHLGGPESDEEVVARHRRYAGIEGKGTGRMFGVALVPEGELVGGIGYWETEWRGETVYETGWSVLPGHQGRGIAVAAGEAAIARAAGEGRHRYLHAFPSVGNPPSNGICRRLGFELLGEIDFEYPKGNPLRCNDWRLDLTAQPAWASAEAVS
jgi:RimJ/RimL family protein N-acetyltransferase